MGISSTLVYSQYEYPDEAKPKEKKKEKNKLLDEESKIFFGGRFGFWFGNTTSIDIAPMIGYKLTPRFWLGGGPRFQHYKTRGNDFKFNTYGLITFAQYLIFTDLQEKININTGDIFAYIENETLYLDDFAGTLTTSSNPYYNITMAGGGFSHSLGGRSRVNIYLLKIINPKENVNSEGLIMRIGFQF